MPDHMRTQNMTTKKTTIKQLQAEISKLEKMRPAIYQAYNQLDEVFSLLVMAREYAKSDKSNNYTIANGIDAIFTSLINIQSNLLDQSGLED